VVERKNKSEEAVKKVERICAALRK